MKNQLIYFITSKMSLSLGISFLFFIALLQICAAQNVNHNKSYYFEDVLTGESFGKLITDSSPGPDDNVGSEMQDGEIVAWQVYLNNTAPAGQRVFLSDPGNMAVIDQLYQAFAKGDIPGALANMDPNIEWNEAESSPYADGNPYIGPQAVVDGVFARIGAEWEYWNLTGIELHEMSNNKVLATLRYQAKYKKNGAEIDAQTAHFWTLKDGKIIRFQQFTDTDQVVRAVAQ